MKTAHRLSLILILTFLALLDIPLLSVNFISIISRSSSVAAQTTTERQAQADQLLQQGIQQFQTSQYKAAIESWQQALTIYQQIEDRNGEAKSLGNLGIAYGFVGEYQKAIEYTQQSLAIFTVIGDRNGEANSLGNLGNAYYSLGEYQKAIEYYQQSLAIFTEIGDRNGEANSLMGLAIAYSSLEEYQKAIDYYQQSLVITSQIGDREGQGKTFSNIGELFEKQNQPELAIVFYKQSVNITESIRFDIRGLDKQLQESYTETVAATYRRLAELLLSQDRFLEAQQVIELLKLQEIQDFTRSPKIRGEMAEVILLPKEQEIIDTYGQLIAFAQKLTECEQTKCPQLTKLYNQRDDLKRDYDRTIKALATSIRNSVAVDDAFLPPQHLNQTATKVIEASDKYNSQKGTVVIYPFVSEDKLWLLWAAEGKVITAREIKDVGREKLNKVVSDLQHLLKDPNSDLNKLQTTSKQLYNWLIQPIETELEKGNIHHLVFSLDRATRYIPMAVLYDGEKYLIEKYTITTIIAAQFTDTSDRLPASINDTPILGLGASNVPGYDPLPHVIDEINYIVKDENSNNNQGIYPGKKFFDKDFNLDNLQTNLADKKILHMATHGNFELGGLYNSYLVLGDEKKLTISEMQVLDNYLDDVHLVVLSGCETALGEDIPIDLKREEGIEINSISYYFITGGAKTVMASLWRVDDSSTSQLMQRFYCILSQSEGKITKTEALKMAQLSLLKKDNNQTQNCPQISSTNNDFSHPYYWSPFILIGNGL